MLSRGLVSLSIHLLSMSYGALRTLCVSLGHVSQILYLGAQLQALAKTQAIRPSESMIGSPVVAIRIKDGRVRKHEDTLLDMNGKDDKWLTGTLEGFKTCGTDIFFIHSINPV